MRESDAEPDSIVILPHNRFRHSFLFRALSALLLGLPILSCLLPASERYTRAVALASDDGWHQVHLGEVLACAVKSDEAVAVFRKLLRDRPDSPHYVSRLDELLTKAGFEKRLEAWRETSPAQSGAVIPPLRLGLALESVGDRSGACQIYAKALETDPPQVEARDLLGKTGGSKQESQQ